MKKLILICTIIGLSGGALYSQARGTPSQLRIKVDANGYLVTAAGAQTDPITQVQFNNARLALDADGNLLVTGTGGGGSGAPANATYITQTLNSGLSAEQAIASLSSGILRGATTTGVITSLGDVLPVVNGGTGSSSLGSDTQVCFNDGGVIKCGDSSFAWDKTTNLLTVTDGGYRGSQTSSSGTTLLALEQLDDSPCIITLQNLGSSDGSCLWISNNGDFNFSGPGANLNWKAINSAQKWTITPAIELTGTWFGTSTISNTNSVSGFVANQFSVAITETNLAAADSLYNLVISSTFGQGGAASIGTFQALTSGIVVAGSGSTDNEYGSHVNSLRADIGSGYAQASGPVGRLWLGDWGIHGPIGIQPDTLNGLVLVANNYYNGTPADSPSGGMWITTHKGGGPGTDAPHQAANTYAIDVGLGITGVSDVSGTPGNGWTRAIQIGATGSPWNETASLIGTVLYARDFATGLDFASKEGADFISSFASDDGDDATDTWTMKVLATGNSITWTNNSTVLSTLTTAGLFTVPTVQPSTAYKSVDGTNGVTVTTCTGFKNGLCISGT